MIEDKDAMLRLKSLVVGKLLGALVLSGLMLPLPLGLGIGTTSHQAVSEFVAGTTIHNLRGGSLASVSAPALPAPTPLWVQNTTDLRNGSITAGNYAPPTGYLYSSMLYDPLTGDSYVSSNTPQCWLTKINDSSWSARWWDPIGSCATSIAYDRSTRSIYLGRFSDYSYYGYVSVINDTTGAFIHNYSWGQDIPARIAIDPQDRFLYDLDFSTVQSYWQLQRVSVNNSTTGQGGESLLGVTPSDLAYDPLLHQVFITVPGGNDVLVIDALNFTIAANLLVGPKPTRIVYDAGDRTMWVADSGGNETTIISAANDTILRNISTVPSPNDLIYDPGDGRMYAESSSTTSVYCLNSSSGALIGTTALGGWPTLGAYDARHHAIIIANDYSGLWGISTVNNSVIATVPLAAVAANDLVVDPSNHLLYATTAVYNGCPCPAAALNATTDRVVSRFRLPLNPTGLTYDGATGNLLFYSESYYLLGAASTRVWEWNVSAARLGRNITNLSGVMTGTYDTGTGNVYLANDTGTVTVIGGKSLTPVASIAVGGCPYSSVDIPARHELFLTDPCRSRVAVLDTLRNQLVANISVSVSDSLSGIAYDSDTGTLAVVETSSPGIALIDPTTLTISSTVRLPGGLGIVYDSVAVSYLVDGGQGRLYRVGGSNLSLAQTITIDTGDTVAAYAPGLGAAFIANTGGTITTIQQRPTFYNVTFRESGLPSGTKWSVEFDGTSRQSSVAAVGYSAPNGSYPFQVIPVPSYVALPDAGTVLVSGSPQVVAILFHPSRVFNVTFLKSGLPRGMNWSVQLANVSKSSTGPTIAFREWNGTYALVVPNLGGYRPLNGSAAGTIIVAGADVSQTILFAAIVIPTYSVTLDETGLADGTNWTVTLNGTQRASGGSATVAFSEPNGTYAYSITPIAGYSTTYDGKVTVNGGPFSTSVTFSRVTYALTFTESALPTGTGWSVTVNGTSDSSASGSIAFTVANGTYSFVIGSVRGYTASPSSGTVHVRGSAVSLLVRFSTYGGGGGSPAGFLGLPGPTGYYVLGALAAVVVGGAASAVGIRRRRARGGEEGTPATGPGSH